MKKRLSRLRLLHLRLAFAFSVEILTLFEFFILLGMAIDAFMRALPYPFIDHRVRAAYYDISDRRSPRGKITPRMAMIVCASMGAITLLSLAYVVMSDPVFIILPPLFAVYVVIILLRDQYRYAQAA